MTEASGHPFRTLVEMARAAERDDRQSSGPLYGKLADRIEELEAVLQDIVALCEHTKPEGKNKYDRATSSLLLTIAKIARAALDNPENKP